MPCWDPFENLRRYIRHQVRKIMASQAELAQSLTDLAAQAAKSKAEVIAAVAALQDAVTTLEAAVAAGSSTTAEVDAALEALKAQVQAIDDLNADAPAP